MRAHFLHFLCDQKGYPTQAIAVEIPVPGSLRADRADALAHGSGSRVRLLMEFKAPGVALGQSVLDQVLRYNMYFGAPWILMSNGLDHYLVQVAAPELGFLPLSALPAYS